ncbi:MAG: PadR family transcriptional regulator [Gammaproteobacteria bacterium]|nr:PadR family transcriptional regulator [Gammaproteobacteria bacterium]
MDVKTLCLGLLSARPASGYDLKKEFESLFKHFFPAGYGSIYPALADLAAAGLVSCEEIPQTGKPDRKVYQVTPAGREAFARALEECQPQHKMRSEFLAALYFADRMEADRVRELLEQRVAELRGAVQHIENIQGNWSGDAPKGARFVAGFGAAVAKAAAAYIEQHKGLLLEDSATARKQRHGAPRPSLENRA